jgi:leucyl aminopeptidase
MEYSVKSGNAEKQRTGCVIVAVFEPRKLSEAAKHLDTASAGELSNLQRKGDIDGHRGQTALLHGLKNTLADRVLVVGCGKERELSDQSFLKVVESMYRALIGTGTTEAVCYLTDLKIKGRDLKWKIRQIIQAVEALRYRADQLKSKKNDEPRRRLRKLVLAVPGRGDLQTGEEAVREAVAAASGVRLARDLANLPPNICTPTYLAEQADQLKATFPNKLKLDVLDEKDMEKLGMGALLAVAHGSEQPAKLIVLQYQGAAKGDKPVVLVGKGVTFDSGGISIKPSQAMDEMKFDMSGAAAVLGTVSAIAEMQLAVNLVALIPATENLPDGRATKPGDIVTSLSGQTIEVLNTDAEGRLILCDALTYAERFEPAAVIDIATLTGACIVALGRYPSGLMSNYRPLANALIEAGEQSGDRVWELPIWDDYQEQLKSNFADMANIGGPDGGAITAACFLARYTKKYHWAHLDIAGTAWKTGEKKGATGRPVPLLVQYLLDRR